MRVMVIEHLAKASENWGEDFPIDLDTFSTWLYFARVHPGRLQACCPDIEDKIKPRDRWRHERLHAVLTTRHSDKRDLAQTILSIIRWLALYTNASRTPP